MDRIMKKTAFLASLITLMFQSNATLTPDGWKSKSYMFSPKTCLIYGFVLNKSELPKNMRYFGNIKYDTSVWNENNPNICSYKDDGLDSMYKSVINFFPSAGAGFNTEGKGSLSELISKFSKLSLVDAIATMFKVDEDVRKKGFDSDILRIEFFKNNGQKKLGYRTKNRFLKNYFGFKSQDPGRYNKLFDLYINIANAIQLEKKEGVLNAENKNKSYPPFFTNYLINAYAWNVLTDDQLDLLAEKLGYIDGRDPYENEFSDRVINDTKMSTQLHWAPFHPGQQIISNDEVTYNEQHFADCVETTLRQFCASMFCKVIESTDEEGPKTENLVLDLDRIPKTATALREFFAPGGVPRDIYSLVNDNTRKTRNEWAAIVSGHPNVKYHKKDCELDTGWINFIKIFCRLMDGYSADKNGLNTERNKKAEERIKKINQNTESVTKDNLLDVINDLLGIRTDTKIIAETKSNLELNDADVYGKISIYPNLGEDSEHFTELNRLNFVQTLGHAELQNIPNNQQNNIDRLILWNFHRLPWIEKLYYDQVQAIRGKNYSDGYPMLKNSNYPLLEFPFRMGGGVRREWIFNSIIEMFCSSTPHMDAIFRKNINNFFIDNLLYAFSTHTEGRIRLYSEESNFLDDYIDLPSPNLIKMLWKSPFTPKNEETLSNIVTCLEKLAPGEASTLFLKKDENGEERLTVNLTDETSIKELIALRAATKHCSEIDSFINKFIEKSYKEALKKEKLGIKHSWIDDDEYENDKWRDFNEVLNIFEELIDLSNNPADIPHFQRSTFDIFIKYLELIPSSQINRTRIVRLTKAFAIMDYDKENTKFQEIYTLEKAIRKRYLNNFLNSGFYQKV